MEVWKFQTGDYVNSSPAVAHGNVYFGSFDKNVYAVNAETEKQYGSSERAARCIPRLR